MDQTTTRKIPIVATIDKIGKATYRIQVRKGSEIVYGKKGSIADIAVGLLDKGYALPRTEARLTCYGVRDTAVIDEVVGTGSDDIWQPFEQVYESSAKQMMGIIEAAPVRRQSSFESEQYTGTPTINRYEVLLEFHTGSISNEINTGLAAVRGALEGVCSEVGTTCGAGSKKVRFYIASTKPRQAIISAIENSYGRLTMFEQPVKHIISPR